ncbi:g-protein alpha subunit [Oesophagostomum dentatum]|uniref:G-protein alpha subunit n=1 Tax=Oesophagostomum dentatum TaxID=61180 RepID=A0A0B1TWD6_OESDE|nr:g-protein alpha subunit [Oesophagostomum dentatum]
MFLCCSGGKDEHTKTIERELHNERKILRRQVKILLLGSGESGKSTFIKQMNIIHGAGEFTADEPHNTYLLIKNAISAMRVLLDARSKLNIPWEKVERQENVDKIMKFTVADLLKGIDYTTFADVAPVIQDFWEDAAVKQAYEQRNLFQIVRGTQTDNTEEHRICIVLQSDSCQYFFDHLSRIAMPNFHPTNKDILYCRKATRGICEHTFDINKIPFRFIDVGGQRSQRQKWFQCFTDITSILFMVASNEYDQVSYVPHFLVVPVNTKSIVNDTANSTMKITEKNIVLILEWS